jgi:hypothetical protein
MTLNCSPILEDDEMIGLMGLGDDGTLYAPDGRKLFRVPMWIGVRVQRLQHWVAKLTWR